LNNEKFLCIRKFAKYTQSTEDGLRSIFQTISCEEVKQFCDMVIPQFHKDEKKTIFFHANPISLRFQPGDFWPPEMRVCVSMYWRLSQGVKSLFQPLVWNHFSDPWGWKHFSVPGTETVSKWFHPRDGKAASLFYSKSSNIHPPLTGITQGVKLVDELGCHS